MDSAAKSIEPHELLQLLIQQKKKIILAGFLLFFFATVYAALKPASYRASVLLQVHHQQDNSLGSMAGTGSFPVSDSLSNEPLAVQMSLIRSRYILAPVIHAYAQTKMSQQHKNSLFSRVGKPLNAEPRFINQLNAHLDARDLTGLSENNTGKPAILQLTLTGRQPDEVIWLINNIAQTTRRRDVERKAVQAKKSLDFLTHQLSAVHKALKKSEEKLNRYRADRGNVDVKVQTQNLLAQLSDTEKEIEAARLEKSALLRTYTPLHPAVIAVTQRQRGLNQQRSAIFVRVKKINKIDQTLDSLEHDVRVKNNLYLAVLSKKHMQEMVAAGIVSDIDILSPATDVETVLPLRLSILGPAAFLTGILLAGLAVILRKLLSVSAGLSHPALLMTPSIPNNPDVLMHAEGHGMQSVDIGKVAE